MKARKRKEQLIIEVLYKQNVFGVMAAKSPNHLIHVFMKSGPHLGTQ